MAGPAAHDFMVDEVLSASVLNNSVVDRISYYAGQELGSDDASEIEAALRILDGSGGRFLGVPGGTTGQRPAGAAGRFRRNSTTGVLEYHDGSGWVSLLEAAAVTAAALIANGSVGISGTQVSYGNHGHIHNIEEMAIREAQSLPSVSDWTNLVYLSTFIAPGPYTAFLYIGGDITSGKTFRLIGAGGGQDVVATFPTPTGNTSLSASFVLTSNFLRLQHNGAAFLGNRDIALIIGSYATT